MRRRQRPDVPGVHEVQDRDGERRALRRIRARTELVDETQAVPVRAPENIDNVGHVRGEGGQILLDALLIPDVGEDLPEHRDLAPVSRRDVQTCHPHELQQADRLERHRLAAGVRSGDDDHVRVLPAEGNIDGDDLLLVDQRVARLAERDIVLLIHHRPNRIHVERETRPGKDEVECRHILLIVFEFGQMLVGLGGEIRENALDLLLLLHLQFPEGIVELYDRRGLDEQRGAGGRLVMYYAGNHALVLSPHRQAVPVVPCRDEGVLQILGVGAVHHLLKLRMDPFVCPELLASDAPQLRTRVVRDVLLRQNTAPDLGGEMGQRNKAVKEILNGAVRAALRFAVRPHPGHIFQKRRQVQQLRRTERCADCQRAKLVREVAVISEIDRTLPENAGHGVLRLLLCPVDFPDVPHRQKRAAALFSGSAVRPLREPGNDFVIFTNTQYFFVHVDIFSMHRNVPGTLATPNQLLQLPDVQAPRFNCRS